MREERKRGTTEHFEAATESGQVVRLERRTYFVRLVGGTGEASPWQEDHGEIYWGTVPVNERDDGLLETAEIPPRLLTPVR